MNRLEARIGRKPFSERALLTPFRIAPELEPIVENNNTAFLYDGGAKAKRLARRFV